MAITHARQLFELGWAQYQGGSRGRDLWANVERFAKAKAFPAAYANPLHGLKELAKASVLDEKDRLKSFLLACELASLTKGMQHHVVVLTGRRAGLVGLSAEAATAADVAEAKRRLETGHVAVPIASAASPMSPTKPADPSKSEKAKPVPRRATPTLRPYPAAYEVGRRFLVEELARSKGLALRQAELIVDLHLDPKLFAMDTIVDYGPIQLAIRRGASRDDVVGLMSFEDTASMRGIFRVHCRNLTNRAQGVADVNGGGPNNAKPPRLLHFLDSLTASDWQAFGDLTVLATQYLSVARRAPRGVFEDNDVRSLEIAVRLGRDLPVLTPTEAKARGMKQGWLKVLRGMGDGVRYLERHQFDAGKFHDYVQEHLASYEQTEALLGEYQHAIYSVGEGLAQNFFGDLGYSAFAKPDVHVTQSVEGIFGRTMSASEVFQAAVELARVCNVATRQMDKIFFLAGRGEFYLTGWKLPDDKGTRRSRLVELIKASG